MTTSIKADKDCNVGTILDIKEQLRDVNALKVNVKKNIVKLIFYFHTFIIFK